MKFENIKVGDTVYIEKTIKYSWNRGETFFIPAKVKRITNTQFVTEGGERFKKDGRGIGGVKYRVAYNIGDSYGWGNKKTVKDQSVEMKLFEEKIRLERFLSQEIESIKVNINSDLTLADLKTVRKTVSRLKAQLTPQ